MNVIECARELGKALQADPRYTAYAAAKLANDNDETLQQQIKDFNSKKMELNIELGKQDKDTDRINALDTELRGLYEAVVGNPKMVAFEKAKADMDEILASVNYIVTAAANGEDPMTCSDTPPMSCSGSCASCSGCH
ncbi:MAG: YlbF family regulator [Oscillospiraceae bacterium]|nr:YlbF family regulator [Oscillospiraceae bacterium]